MSAMATRRGPTPSSGEEGRLQAVAEELRRRGWDAQVVVHRVVGDRDVRLEASGAGDVGAELLDTGDLGTGDLDTGDLDTGDEASCGDRWQAVRVAPDGRAVWCGPSRPCPVDAVASFVEDLLRRDEAELLDRHLRLG